MSTTPPPPTEDPVTRRRKLACVRCQGRKIKCTGGSPCSHCIRTNSQCVPSNPAPVRQRRRRTENRLKERLAHCEGLLSEYLSRGGEVPPVHDGSSSCSTPHPIANQPPVLKWTPIDGKLVEEVDGKIAFMDNHLISMVHEELRAIREIVSADESNESCGADFDITDDNNSDLILGGNSSPVDIDGLWPNPALLFKLWQIFIDRVNPLVKIIHIPSFQPYVVKATNGLQSVPDNIAALLLSIFLMATVSLSDIECESLFNDSKAVVMNRFSSGLRQSLRRLGILLTNDFVVLQALVLFLISLQGRYDRHAAWVINGLVIRIAQKMGLHRDGELLGLKPFESEMRRRVWWQIVAIDTKFALFSGLGHSLFPRDWDVREPANLNDADIFPAATQPFSDRDGPTEMIFCLVQYKITKFLVETPGFEPVKMANELNGIDQKQPPDAARIQQMNYYRAHFDMVEQNLLTLLEKRCDPAAGQIHRMARGVVTTLLAQKRELVNGIRHRFHSESKERSEDNLAFKSSIAVMEHATSLYTSTQNTGFVWFVLANIQLDVLLYMAVQLYRRTDDELVQRAWDQVAILYQVHPDLFDFTLATSWRLRNIVLMAWAKRREALVNMGHLVENPEYINRLQRSLGLKVGSGAMPSNLEDPMSLKTESPVRHVTGAGEEAGTSLLQSPEGDGFVGDWDWSFLDTVNAAQVNESTNFSYLGYYAAGPSVDW